MGDLDFAWALLQLKLGQRVARVAWHGRKLGHDMWIAIQKPDENSKMGHPYFYMCVADGKLIPWVPSHTDMLANDWQIIE